MTKCLTKDSPSKISLKLCGSRNVILLYFKNRNGRSSAIRNPCFEESLELSAFFIYHFAGLWSAFSPLSFCLLNFSKSLSLPSNTHIWIHSNTLKVLILSGFVYTSYPTQNFSFLLSIFLKAWFLFHNSILPFILNNTLV
jgi:hypothetical protein